MRIPKVIRAFAKLNNVSPERAMELLGKGLLPTQTKVVTVDAPTSYVWNREMVAKAHAMLNCARAFYGEFSPEDQTKVKATISAVRKALGDSTENVKIPAELDVRFAKVWAAITKSEKFDKVIFNRAVAKSLRLNAYLANGGASTQTKERKATKAATLTLE